ncbi:MAG: hypothetical protein K2X91_13520, partial [Thermoleophilia bacterium]|nr:hypothetical protein [Thermoleophilia bacterium]
HPVPAGGSKGARGRPAGSGRTKQRGRIGNPLRIIAKSWRGGGLSPKSITLYSAFVAQEIPPGHRP